MKYLVKFANSLFVLIIGLCEMMNGLNVDYFLAITFNEFFFCVCVCVCLTSILSRWNDEKLLNHLMNAITFLV